jgi:hypothetical protein
MDVYREIQQLKKLIPNAEGENLAYLVERLHTLVSKQESKEREDQPVVDTEPAGIRPPSLQIKEKHRSLKIIGIDREVLKQMFINSEVVRDFIMKGCEYIINKITQDESLLKLINRKFYLQLKTVFEYAHDKPYEPTLKTIKKPFYPDKLIQRSNLAQSVDDFRRIVETQAEEILRMIHNFEQEGSNWVIVKTTSV